METKIKNLKLFVATLFLFAVPFSASAEIYPLYICGGGTANLKPDATVEAALIIGDKVVWQEFDGSDNPIGTASTLPVITAGTAPGFATDVALTVGEHRFKVFIISATPNNCSGDVSDAFELYVLPTKTLALSAPSAAQYCENATTPSSILVATPTSAATLPEDVGYAYTWSATKDGGSAVNGTTIGTATSDATTGTLTVNTAVKGVYVIGASVAYTVPSGSVLKSGDNAGCVQPSSTQTVTVAPKPGKPTITIAI